jgi:hypothetical protein
MMLEELQRRNYSAITTRNYLRVVTEFAKHFGKSPDKLGPNELRTYQAYLLTERKLTPGTVVNRVAALRFFFVKTLKRYQFREFLPYPRDRRRLPTVLSQEEVSQLINGAGNLFRRTLLMTLLAGLKRLHSRNQLCRRRPRIRSSSLNSSAASIDMTGSSMLSPPSVDPCRCCAISAATPIAWPFPIIACWPSTRSASPFAGRIMPTAASKAR